MSNKWSWINKKNTFICLPYLRHCISSVNPSIFKFNSSTFFYSFWFVIWRFLTYSFVSHSVVLGVLFFLFFRLNNLTFRLAWLTLTRWIWGWLKVVLILLVSDIIFNYFWGYYCLWLIAKLRLIFRLKTQKSRQIKFRLFKVILLIHLINWREIENVRK